MRQVSLRRCFSGALAAGRNVAQGSQIPRNERLVATRFRVPTFFLAQNELVLIFPLPIFGRGGLSGVGQAGGRCGLRIAS